MFGGFGDCGVVAGLGAATGDAKQHEVHVGRGDSCVVVYLAECVLGDGEFCYWVRVERVGRG